MAAYANPLNANPGTQSGNTNWSPFGGPGMAPGSFSPLIGAGNPGTGSNQYFSSMPGMPNPGQASTPGASQSNPYQVPAQGSPQGTGGGFGGPSYGATNTGQSGIVATNLQYPQMSSEWAQYLQSQIGQGMSPFDLSTMLPTGGSTAPGQLTAGLNPMMQQLMQFFMTGQGGGPGMQSLATVANQGVSALPEWQSMVAAMQPNIQQNQAQMQEQFAGMGDLAGSPFGTAASNYSAQTALGQNSLLAQLQQQNIGTQMNAAQFLQNGEQQFGNQLQTLDQNAINAMYQEFQRVSPQNNPMNSYMGQMATLYPPTTKTPTAFQDFMNLLPDISSMMGATSNLPGVPW